MNISQSTYSNNSRFVSSHKDPLQKFKLSQKEKFKQMYDAINEQQFCQPFLPQDGTIFLTDQQSLKSFLNSTQKFEEHSVIEDQHFSIKQSMEQINAGYEESLTAKKTKHRIFDPLPFQEQLFKSLITTQNMRHLSEKQCQTSFLEAKYKTQTILPEVVIDKPKQSKGIQVDRTLQQIPKENVSIQNSLKSCRSASELINISSYLDRHYDYQQFEPHHNWGMNVSEQRLLSNQDEFSYSFCEDCQQFFKRVNNCNAAHLNVCQQQVFECTFTQMIGKFQYLLTMETNQLRDIDQQCKEIRKYCFAAQQICILLQSMDKQLECNTQYQKRSSQLIKDLLKINREVQKFKNTNTKRITQLFEKLTLQLQK